MNDPVTVDPAAVADLSTEPLPGLLLDWRWLDRERGRWVALVRVRTATLLQFERWVGGEYVRRVTPPRGSTRGSTPPRMTKPPGRRMCL